MSTLVYFQKDCEKLKQFLSNFGEKKNNKYLQENLYVEIETAVCEEHKPNFSGCAP